MQSRRLEQDRQSPVANNAIELLTVESHNISLLIFDIGSRDKHFGLSQGIAGPTQDVVLFGLGEQIHVAGIHVHSVDQMNLVRRDQMPLK